MQTFNQTDALISDIFYPGTMGRLSEIESGNRRFAYYTSADTARKIILKKGVWLRNATVMNDFSEISYGLSLVKEALSGRYGKCFSTAANTVFPDVMDKIRPKLIEWELHWQVETYILCLSLHESLEDQNGRLSMWRAYGDVALIINNTPLTVFSDRLGAYSTPVYYLDQTGADARLKTVAQAILDNVDFIRNLGEKVFIDCAINMVFLAAIGTKHPGFSEEKEWRIYFRPVGGPNSVLKSKVVVINNVPQEIWVLPLRHDPDNGLHHADIPNLLDRIIVGPTPYPYVSARAFMKLLEEVGVDDVSRKVVVSDIPLRTRGKVSSI